MSAHHIIFTFSSLLRCYVFTVHFLHQPLFEYVNDYELMYYCIAKLNRAMQLLLLNNRLLHH